LVDEAVNAGFGAIAEGEQPASSLSNCVKGYWARSCQNGAMSLNNSMPTRLSSPAGGGRGRPRTLG